MALLQKKTERAEVDPARIPRHIAIIMDGNGRWARKRGLPRPAGHIAGAETFRRIATYAKDIGVEYLTVYAFSTENWKRPLEEVQAIMKLLKKYLLEALETMEQDGIRICFFGDLSPLSDELKELAQQVIDTSSRIEGGCQVNLCINYGGRDEIVRAVKAWQQDCAAGKCDPAELTEAVLSGYLFSKGVPDPELIIRPSGELRTSNFLLWQSAYSEFYFSDVLWPDYTAEDLNEAIAAFQKRNRRFGGV